MYWQIFATTVLLSFLCHLSEIHGARILALLPLPIWSHYMQVESLLEALASRGHQLTVYSPFPPKTNLTNLRHVFVTLPKMHERLENFNHFELKDTKTFENDGMFSQFESTIENSRYALLAAAEILNDTNLQSLIKSHDEYDLLLAELFFCQEALVGFGHKFKIPIVGLVSFGTPANVYSSMGVPNLYSFMPDYRLAFRPKMTFLQRLENTLLGLFENMVAHWWYLPQQNALMKQFCADENVPSITDMLRNISVAFIYSDLLLDFQKPQPSNVVYVGGMHLKTKKLPKDLEDIMNNAQKGVILVSFGSLIKPSRMSENMKNILVDAFKEIGLTVLWRWEGEAMPNLPTNVIIRKWVPQQDILAHPNCRLFINHGGMGSTMETIHYGVPIVGVPFYNDQYTNVKRVVDLGAGVEISYFNITRQSLVWAANTVLDNPSYKRNAVAISQRFNDRMQSPVETAVWWMEYVARHRGAAHLRSAYDNVSWLEFLLLDVFGLIFVVVFVFLYLLWRIFMALKNVVLRFKKVKC